jgi:hypothetical protein
VSPELVHDLAVWALGPHPILSAVALPLLLVTAALLLLALWVVQGARLALFVALAGGALLWLRDRAPGGGSRGSPAPSGGRGGRSARYQAVMRSAGWRRRRARALRRAGGRCETPGCGGRAVDVHHTTYQDLGHERPWQLRALCERCHARLHGREEGGA